MAQLPVDQPKKLKEFSQASRDMNYKDQACFFFKCILG